MALTIGTLLNWAALGPIAIAGTPWIVTANDNFPDALGYSPAEIAAGHEVFSSRSGCKSSEALLGSVNEMLAQRPWPSSARLSNDGKHLGPVY
jgi:hypothetical protein